MFRRNHIAGRSLPVIATALVGLLFAAASLQAQQSGGGSSGEALFGFSGGTLIGTRIVTQNSPTTTGSAAFVALPSASIAATVPAGASRLLVVRFTGECRMRTTGTNGNDWVEIRVVRNPGAIPLQPNDVASAQALCGANSYNMNGGIWAVRLPAGAYSIQVQWRVVDSAPLNPGLSGWLDDWTMEVDTFI